MIAVVLGAVAIGLVLGLLGSGGSILTVPVLVYLAHVPEKMAIAESLAIVGTIALFGMLPHWRQGHVVWRRVALFGGGGLAGAYLGATLAQWIPGAVQLVLFAVVMIAAAFAMFRGRPQSDGGSERSIPAWRVAALGVVVGIMTGLVGVGGGFLIVPALVLLVGLPMHDAVGTSLAIIVLNSAAGFAKYVDVLAARGASVDWRLIALFAAVGVAGSFVGNLVGRHVDQHQLRRGFAVFLVVMGGFILVREAPGAFGGKRPAPSSAESS